MTYKPDGTRTTPTITIGLKFPEGIAVDKNGNIYVASFEGSGSGCGGQGCGSVTVYKPNGTRTTPTITAGLNGPEGIAFDSTDGLLYVANINGGNVTTYNPTTGAETEPTISSLSTPIGLAHH